MESQPFRLFNNYIEYHLDREILKERENPSYNLLSNLTQHLQFNTYYHHRDITIIKTPGTPLLSTERVKLLL